MIITTTLRALKSDRVRQLLDAGAIVVDLRPTQDYLSAHIVGSIPLLYEAGPGLGGRARDLLPLECRLLLLEDPISPLDKAADALRGKGFDVVGYIAGGVGAWTITKLGGTGVIPLANTPPHLNLLDVADPGTDIPAARPRTRIPAEQLWDRVGELDASEPIGVLSGFGVRAAAGIGILEHLGIRELSLVRTRDIGARPVTAGTANFFRAGGPA